MKRAKLLILPSDKNTIDSVTETTVKLNTKKRECQFVLDGIAKFEEDFKFDKLCDTFIQKYLNGSDICLILKKSVESSTTTSKTAMIFSLLGSYATEKTLGEMDDSCEFSLQMSLVEIGKENFKDLLSNEIITLQPSDGNLFSVVKFIPITTHNQVIGHLNDSINKNVLATFSLEQKIQPSGLIRNSNLYILYVSEQSTAVQSKFSFRSSASKLNQKTQEHLFETLLDWMFQSRSFTNESTPSLLSDVLHQTLGAIPDVCMILASKFLKQDREENIVDLKYMEKMIEKAKNDYIFNEVKKASSMDTLISNDDSSSQEESFENEPDAILRPPEFISNLGSEELVDLLVSELKQRFATRTEKPWGNDNDTVKLKSELDSLQKELSLTQSKLQQVQNENIHNIKESEGLKSVIKKLDQEIKRLSTTQTPAPETQSTTTLQSFNTIENQNAAMSAKSTDEEVELDIEEEIFMENRALASKILVGCDDYPKFADGLLESRFVAAEKKLYEKSEAQVIITPNKVDFASDLSLIKSDLDNELSKSQKELEKSAEVVSKFEREIERLNLEISRLSHELDKKDNLNTRLKDDFNVKIKSMEELIIKYKNKSKLYDKSVAEVDRLTLLISNLKRKAKEDADKIVELENTKNKEISILKKQMHDLEKSNRQHDAAIERERKKYDKKNEEYENIKRNLSLPKQKQLRKTASVGDTTIKAKEESIELPSFDKILASNPKFSALLKKLNSANNISDTKNIISEILLYPLEGKTYNENTSKIDSNIQTDDQVVDEKTVLLQKDLLYYKSTTKNLKRKLKELVGINNKLAQSINQGHIDGTIDSGIKVTRLVT